jgi:hypothetical protein
MQTIINNKLTSLFIQDLEKEGIPWDPIKSQNRSADWRVKLLSLKKGTVLVCKAYLRSHRYFSIKKPETKADFLAFYVPEKGWMITTYKDCPKETTISLEKPRLPGATTNRHDYGNMLNNWRILK